MVVYRTGHSARALSSLILLLLLMTAPYWASAQGFEECIQSSQTATVVVPEDVDGGDDYLNAGDQIAAMTDDGVCTGQNTWDDEAMAVTVSGNDEQYDNAYTSGVDELQFQIWISDAGTTSEMTVTYEPCDDDPLCEDDGIYRDGGIYILESISAESYPEPILEVTPSDHDFETVDIGESLDQVITLENTGEAPAEVTALDVSDDADEAFSLTDNTTPISLDAGDTHEFTATYAPTDEGSHQADIEIEHSADNDSPMTLPLSGTATDPSEPHLAVDPEPIDFGTVLVGESATETVTVENDGDAELSGSVGKPSESFTVTSGAGDFTLDAGESRDVEVTYAPEETGEAASSFDIEAEEADDVTVTLEGKAELLELVVDPEEIDFETLGVGSTATETLTLSNEGDTPLEGDLQWDEVPSSFTLADDAPFDIAPGEAHEILIEYQPDEPGSHTATLDIDHNASNQETPLSLDVNGEASAPDEPHLAVDPETVDFGTLDIDNTATEILTISNEGDVPLEGDLQWDDVPSFFSLANDEPFDIPPGEEREVLIEYEPDEPGSHTATLDIDHNAPNQEMPLSLTVEGTAEAPEDPITLTSLEAEASSGQTAQLRWTAEAKSESIEFEIEHRKVDEPDTWTSLGVLNGENPPAEEEAYEYETEPLPPGHHEFRLRFTAKELSEHSDPVEVVIEPDAEYAFSPPAPNPFSDRTRFTMQVEEEQHVLVAVYNALGQRVTVLHDGPMIPQREEEITLNIQDLQSGVYFIRAQGERFRTSRRVVAVR